MKKYSGIFVSTIAILLPIVILTNLIILSVGYKYIYDYTLAYCTEDVITAAKVIEDYVGIYDLNSKKDVEICNNSLNALCREFDITYSYVLKIDQEQNSETYISIGIGKNASKDFINERKPGDVIVGMLSQEQIDAVNNTKDYTVQHEKTKYDDTVVCFVPLKHVYNTEKKTFEEAQKTDCIVAAEMSFSEVMANFKKLFSNVVLLNFALTVSMVFAFAALMYRKIAKPAKIISDRMSNYIDSHKQGYEKLNIKGNNEFSNMAREFNTMTDEINSYIKNIKLLNKEKHMQEAELDIARNIQLGLLPSRKYKNSDVSIDAYMYSAKEVGGDLYDYQISENGEIYLSVADVSGKGVSAALFMSRAITLLNMYARLGMSPSKIAEEFNNTLAKNNPNKLFITAFIAKYNPKTRELTYTNAGHNEPYIISDKLIILDKAHCMAAGIFSDLSYEEVTVTLKEGDALFMFTDGVNEAQNNQKHFFSTEYLEKILSEHTKTKNKILEDVLQELRSFADGAVQSDDVTMLLMKTEKSYHRTLELKSHKEQLLLINDAIDEIPDLSDTDNYRLKLMAEEIFVNICNYSFGNDIGEVEVIIDSDENVELTFIDGGIEYDPTKEVLEIDKYDHNNTVGGLGKFITFNTADCYSYRRENGKNILKLTITKRFED